MGPQAMQPSLTRWRKKSNPAFPLVGTELRRQVRQKKQNLLMGKKTNTINGRSLIRLPLVGTELR
jgi:hypothetical protein